MSVGIAKQPPRQGKTRSQIPHPDKSAFRDFSQTDRLSQPIKKNTALYSDPAHLPAITSLI
jgi:hypothetical protein